uniref:Apoptosis-inducing factor 1, mitochondrial n=1 Tax=Rhabditophanes sp. KR3021 TaxID=114890 RepID=A0AC35UA52_9BILA
MLRLSKGLNFKVWPSNVSKCNLWTAVWKDAEKRAQATATTTNFRTRTRTYSTSNHHHSDYSDQKECGSKVFAGAAATAAIIAATGIFLTDRVYAKEGSSVKVVGEVVEPGKERDHQSVGECQEDGEKKASCPLHVPYLLIGGGTASYYAATTIRAKIAGAHCLIVGEENLDPYNRPPLSRDVWWYGDASTPSTLEYTSVTGKKRQVPYESHGFYISPQNVDQFPNGAISILNGKKVVKVVAADHKAILDDGTEIFYEKCLIATGSKAKQFDTFAKPQFQDKITTLRDVNDYRKIASIIDGGVRDVLIIGGGLLGSELAYSLTKKRKDVESESPKVKVTQIFRGSGVLSGILPEHMSSYAALEMKKAGVDVISQMKVIDGRVLEDGKIELVMEGEDGKYRTVSGDHVIVAIGATPNIELASASKLELDPILGGACADSGMRSTLHPDIYLAGDIASFYDPLFGRRRVEHWEHAQVSGRVAGENMAGGSKRYTHQASWFSILAPHLHYTAVGRTESELETVAVFAADVETMGDDKTTIQKGVVYYLDNKKIVGVLLLNVFDIGVEIGRRIIADQPEDLDFLELSKLFEIYPLTSSEEEENVEKERDAEKIERLENERQD